MAVRIVAAMKIFNEAWHIKRTLLDVVRLVDHVIVVDGAWKHYPRGLPKSNDGTLEILEEFSSQGVSIEVITHNAGKLWDNQPAARSEYFRRGMPGDWFFQVDGDYEVTCNIDLGRWIEDNCRGKINTVLVPFINDEDLTKCYFPLIMKWEPGMEYRGNHYTLFVGDKKRVLITGKIPELVITHCHKNKPKVKKDNMGEYSVWRRDRGWKED